MRKKMKYLGWGVIVCILFFGIISESRADLAVKPMMAEFSQKPGAVYQGSYEVINRGKWPIHVEIEVVDWLADFLGVERGYPVDSWFSLETKSFDIKAQETKFIKYEMKVPQDLTGELVAQVFFKRPIGVGVETKMGAIVYVSANGTERIEAEVENLQIAQIRKGDQKMAGLRGHIIVNNKGNVHVRPYGVLDLLKGEEKEKVATFEIPYLVGVYPKNNFEIKTKDVDVELESGEYTAKVMIDIGKVFGIEQWITFEKKITWDNEQKMEIDSDYVSPGAETRDAYKKYQDEIEKKKPKKPKPKPVDKMKFANIYGKKK